MKLLSLSEFCCQLHGSLSLLVLDLIPPEPVLVEYSKAVNDDGDGKGEDEYSRQGTESSDEFPQQCLGIEFVSHGCDGHQSPPKCLHKCPAITRMVDY